MRLFSRAAWACIGRVDWQGGEECVGDVTVRPSSTNRPAGVRFWLGTFHFALR